jgi:glutathionylspermidine synthase
MHRQSLQPRPDWQQKVEDLGFGFHTAETAYWDESACYTFRMEEVLQIERATADLWDMCLEAVQHVMDHGLYDLFHIPSWVIPYLERTWEEDQPSIYGRFDLCYKDGQIKMLEFNADTPTSLFEAGVVQWFWLQEVAPELDQFNSIHERLIAYWSYLSAYLNPGILYFSCVPGSPEDLTNCEYLRDCAMQAGLTTERLFIDEIGWNSSQGVFVDLNEAPMANLFKLYPWEWMVHEPFGHHIPVDRAGIKIIEPAWKMILSNKAILPILWKLFPEHPLLLPAYFEPGHLEDYARKPLLSREGANIDLVRNRRPLFHTEGEYGEEGYIYQGLFELPSYEGRFPLIGSWIIGQEPAGMGIRESDVLVTDNLSRFVPHMIVP